MPTNLATVPRVLATRRNSSAILRMMLALVAFMTWNVTNHAFAESDADRMNVVFFLVDDLGWRDLGCQGSRYYETPHIDALANRGVRFTQAYASAPLCSPTRAALLTGKAPARLMLTQWLPGGRFAENLASHRVLEGRCVQALVNEEVTIAESLREAGYATGYIGKWHLGSPPIYSPRSQGFDVAIAANDMGNPGSYFYPFKVNWRIPNTEFNGQWVTANLLTFEGGNTGDYLTDALTDEAVSFIQAQQDRPFFLYMSYYNVHTPLEGKPDKVAKYQNRIPDDGQKNPVYAAMIESVDDSVGRIVQTLKSLGVFERTLIVFTSDNGGNLIDSNRPLRSQKGTPFEGGLRVPAIIVDPRIEQPGVCHTPIISADFYPTILDLLSLPMRPHQHLDGNSLRPLVQNPNSDGLAERSLFWHYPHYNQRKEGFPFGAIRQGSWKLIENYDRDEVYLYNLQVDPGEQKNVAAAHLDRVASLRASLDAWKQNVGADPVRPNPVYQSN